MYARDTFKNLVNGDRSLMYSASTNALNRKADTDSFMDGHAIPRVMLSATQRYFTLQVIPSAIYWSTASFQSVQVIVRATVADVVQDPLVMIWGAGACNPQYMTVPIQVGQKVAYEWTASYIAEGKSPQKFFGTSTSAILHIPPVTGNGGTLLSDRERNNKQPILVYEE